MAEVFLAIHRGPGGYEKRLVIKRILPQKAANPRFLRMFFEEARLHVSLSHGNLVSIFDFGRVGNSYFLAMELVEGRDLATLLRDCREPLPASCVALIGQELCRGLGYVHRHGLVHRDLTPRNVLLSTDGEVKLADFGVVQHDGASDRSVIGTPAYMSPEQATGASVDGRADVYALGLLLAEAATGRPVRELHGTPETTIAKISDAARVEIAGPFAEVVARATEPDPAARYATAAAMGEALEHVERTIGGSRAEAVRVLSELVRAVKEPTQVITTGDVQDGPATYYGDAKTQVSIVDEIVGVARRPARTWLAVGVAVFALLSVGVAVRSSRRAPSPSAPAIPLPSASAPAPDLATFGSPPMVVETMTEYPRRQQTQGPPQVAAPPTRRRQAAAAVSRAVVRLQCTPWCTVDVDGRRQGEDGLTHFLTLPVGRHELVIRRLDDAQRKIVDLAPGADTQIKIAFD